MGSCVRRYIFYRIMNFNFQQIKNKAKFTPTTTIKGEHVKGKGTIDSFRKRKKKF